MHRFLISHSLSLLPRSFLSHQTINHNFHPSSLVTTLISPSASFLFSLNSFSSSGSTDSVTPTSTQKDDDDDDVTNQELKKRIEKFFEGDEDAIPSIFEAILKRKLAGKHDESDNELLDEFGCKSPDDKYSDSE